MNKDYLDKEKQLAAQEKTLDKTKWQCMCPKCTETAINSHLLQRHGVLDNVAENGHLCEIKMEDFFKWHEKEPMKVKKVGLQHAISYPLFCKKHDTELFLPIEGESIDFDDYRSQLLFSYRGVCSEIRKKEFVKIRYGAWEENEFKHSHALGTEKGLYDVTYYKYLFERELEKPQGKFNFVHLSYPFLPVYACGAISYEPVDYNKERSVDEAIKKKVWDGIFVSIIPQKESLEIIIGYHNNHTNADLCNYVNSWRNLTTEQLQVKLTDLFTARLEMWGLAPSLYDGLTEEKRKWLMDNMSRVHLDLCYDIRRELNYNIFG